MLNILNNMNLETNAIALAPIDTPNINENNLELAKYFYNGSKVHTKYTEISEKLDGLIKEFNPDKVKEVFYDLVLTDQDLYVDIITAMQILTNNKDNICLVDYIKMMNRVEMKEPVSDETIKE